MQENNTITFIFLAILLLLIFIICFLIYQLMQFKKAKDDAEKSFYALEMKVNDLQLETLESKLNPHLFKNILNSIQSHAYQTYFALDKLANVLDFIL